MPYCESNDLDFIALVAPITFVKQALASQDKGTRPAAVPRHTHPLIVPGSFVKVSPLAAVNSMLPSIAVLSYPALNNAEDHKGALSLDNPGTPNTILDKRGSSP